MLGIGFLLGTLSFLYMNVVLTYFGIWLSNNSANAWLSGAWHTALGDPSAQHWFVHKYFSLRSIDGGSADTVSIDVSTFQPVHLVIFIVANTILWLVWAIPHVGMVSSDFKALLSYIIAPRYERIFYNFIASVLLHFFVLHWTPLPFAMGEMLRFLTTGRPFSPFPHDVQLLSMFPFLPQQQHYVFPLFIDGLGTLGALLAFYSVFQFDLWEFVGVKQLFMSDEDWLKHRQAQQKVSAPVLSGMYGWVRHPQMSGVVMVCWCTSTMSFGRFLFAVEATLFIFLACKYFEEPRLIREFGEKYKKYMKFVPYRFIPFVF